MPGKTLFIQSEKKIILSLNWNEGQLDVRAHTFRIPFEQLYEFCFGASSVAQSDNNRCFTWWTKHEKKDPHTFQSHLLPFT